jgi:hypothetical protein
MLPKPSPDRPSVRPTVLDHSQIALRAEALAPALRQADYEAIVCVLRGGLHLAAHAAFATGLPLHFLRYSRDERGVAWQGPPPEARRLLLCEDFAGKGFTLLDCEAYLRHGGFQVETLVICVDALSASQPRWRLFQAAHPEERFLLPWERHRRNPLAADSAAGVADHTLRRTAWDLDGVFVADLEAHHYRNDLRAALSRRDTLPLAEFAPRPSPDELIITGRPESDAERTLEWCQRVGVQLRVIFRDDQRDWPTPEEVARFKADRALALGCTDYVESDATQAALMAQTYPQLRVTWWNEGRPALLQAALLGRSFHFQIKR